jgi:hypothetical protein
MNEQVGGAHGEWKGHPTIHILYNPAKSGISLHAPFQANQEIMVPADSWQVWL